jgi:hypothetical protein
MAEEISAGRVDFDPVQSPARIGFEIQHDSFGAKLAFDNGMHVSAPDVGRQQVP